MSPRRNRRTTFLGVERMLETEGHRSEVRAETVCEVICQFTAQSSTKISLRTGS